MLGKTEGSGRHQNSGIATAKLSVVIGLVAFHGSMRRGKTGFGRVLGRYRIEGAGPFVIQVSSRPFAALSHVGMKPWLWVSFAGFEHVSPCGPIRRGLFPQHNGGIPAP
jgi:hypothetical protein